MSAQGQQGRHRTQSSAAATPIFHSCRWVSRFAALGFHHQKPRISLKRAAAAARQQGSEAGNAPAPFVGAAGGAAGGELLQGSGARCGAFAGQAAAGLWGGSLAPSLSASTQRDRRFLLFWTQ